MYCFQDKDGALYDCTPLPLYEVGSCHYDNYVLNIRVPAFDEDRVNEDIGKLIDMTLVVSIKTDKQMCGAVKIYSVVLK